MAGLILGAAQQEIPLIADGFISTAAAAIAFAIAPHVRGYLFAGHQSEEPGHRILPRLHRTEADPLSICDWAKEQAPCWPCRSSSPQCVFTTKWQHSRRPVSVRLRSDPSATNPQVWQGNGDCIPVSHAHSYAGDRFEPDSLARAIKFFPLVGLVVGLGAVLLQRIALLHFDRSLSALLVLIYFVLITGCFHEDGLSRFGRWIWRWPK